MSLVRPDLLPVLLSVVATAGVLAGLGTWLVTRQPTLAAGVVLDLLLAAALLGLGSGAGWGAIAAAAGLVAVRRLVGVRGLVAVRPRISPGR